MLADIFRPLPRPLHKSTLISSFCFKSKRMSPLRSLAALVPLFVAIAYGQQIGTNTPEINPPLLWEECTFPGLCQKVNGSVTIDSNYRWTHNVGGYTNCKNGNTWDATFCPDATTCAENCAVEGVDYASSGVFTSGNALTLSLNTVTNSGPPPLPPQL